MKPTESEMLKVHALMTKSVQADMKRLGVSEQESFAGNMKNLHAKWPKVFKQYMAWLETAAK